MLSALYLLFVDVMYSAQNNNWDWKFVFFAPYIEFSTKYHVLSTSHNNTDCLQLILYCNKLYYFICKQFFPGQLALG